MSATSSAISKNTQATAAQPAAENAKVDAENAKVDPEYMAGLLDGQLSVTFKKYGILRAVLANSDDRISSVVRDMFIPTRETIVKTPKKTACVMEFVGADAVPLLEFVRDKCAVRGCVAKLALDYLGENNSEEAKAAIREAIGAAQADVPEEVSCAWIGGFFDAKGEVTCADKRRAVRVVTSRKDPEGILEAIRKTAGGKVKKSRLVFDTKNAIRGFVEACGDHVRVREPEMTKITKCV